MSGAEERERARQRRHALAVAADDARARSPARRHAPRSRARDRRAPGLRRRRRPATASAACRRCSNSAGDFAIVVHVCSAAMERDQRRNSARVDLGGHRLRAVDPGENLLVGHFQPALVFVELGARSAPRDARRRSGRAPDPFRGCRDGGERNSSRRRRGSSPSLEISFKPILQRQKPGRGRVRVI